MNPFVTAILRRFAKGFVASFASTAAQLPAITFGSWTDISNYSHAFWIAVIAAALLALEKTLSWQDAPPAPVQVPPKA